MGPSRRWAVDVAPLALVLLVVVTVAIAGLAGAQTATPTAEPETDNTATQIVVDENGTATWTIHVRTRLATEEEVGQYRTFQDRFRSNRSAYLEPFSRRMQRVVAGAGDATGREMAAGGFEASTQIQEVPRRWGIVSFEFTWVGFAERRDGELVVGDVFEGGFFLAGNDTLSVSAPSGFTVVEAAPPVASRNERTVTWIGRVDFADGQPLVRMVPSAGGSPDGIASPPSSGTPAGPSGGPGLGVGGWISIAGVALVAVAALAAGLYLVRRRGGSPGGGGAPAGSSSGGSRLVTDADRVTSLLEAHGGRMRQADVAEELGWSTSKTSRVLASMEEAGAIEKLRLGRENVIDLVDDQD